MNETEITPEKLEAIENRNVETLAEYLTALADDDNQAVSNFFDEHFAEDGTFVFGEIKQDYKEDGSYDLSRVLPLARDANNLEETKSLFNEFLTEFEIEDLKVGKYVAQENQVGVYSEIRLRNTRTGSEINTPLFIETKFNEEGEIEYARTYLDTYAVAATARIGGSWERIHNGERVKAIFGSNDEEILAATGDIPNIVLGYGGNDSLLAGKNNDILYGYDGQDKLTGGNGDNQLWGNLGNDTLTGGSGSDTFVLARGDGVDTITDFVVGEDTLGLFGDLTVEDLTFTQDGSNVVIQISDNGEQLATLTEIEVGQVDSAENFENIQKSNTTELIFPEDPVEARKEQTAISPEDETRNREVAAGFFDSLVNNTFREYARGNFTSDAEYRVIQENNDPNNPFSRERNLVLPFTRLYEEGPEAVIDFLEDLTRENIPRKLEINNLLVEGNDAFAFGGFNFTNRWTGNTIGEPRLAVKLELDEQGKIDQYLFMENTFAFIFTSRIETKWTTVYGGETRDITFGSYADNNYVGEDRIDEIYGYAGSDDIKGGGGNDLLRGGTGDDFIEGNEGNDSLYGDGGKDLFVLAPNQGTDTINDFGNNFDQLVLSEELTFDDLTIAQDGSDTTIDVIDTGERLATLIGVDASVIDPKDLVLTFDGGQELSEPFFDGDGDDQFFIGTEGDNILAGGVGTDRFGIANREVSDASNTITDFELGTGVIGIGGLNINFENLSLTQDGADTIIAAPEPNPEILTGIRQLA